MVACINRGLSEYQSLKNMAGIPLTILDFWCQYYLTKFNRFPYLDELPGVNSEQHLKDKLKVKQVGNSQISEVNSLYELTGINSFSESIIKLNNVYKDLQIQGVDLGNGKFFIDIVHRPTEENQLDLILLEMLEIKEKAIADGTFMKAPNGKPTNLNERLWLQVRTKAFKNWFGNWTKITFDKDGKVLNIPNNVSKVVDENGEPLVVYHGNGSSEDLNRIDVFDRESIKSKGKYLYYFSTNKISAQSYIKSYRYKESNLFDKNKAFKDVLSYYSTYYPTAVETLKQFDNFKDAIKFLEKELERITGKVENRHLNYNGILVDYEHFDKQSKEDKRLADDYTKLINYFIVGDHFKNSRFDNFKDWATYEVFLNIKTPFKIDAKENNWNDFEWSFRKKNGQYIEDYYLNNKSEEDGLEIDNYMDMYDSSDDKNIISITYAVKESNQIKSATDNVGTFNKNNLNIYDYEETSVNNKTILVNSLMKLQKYYGINIIPISTDDIDSSKEFQQLPEEAKLAKAFIFNGNIYLNTDFAGILSPIHELLHIFLGGMRYTNPGQYMEIISKLDTPNIDELQNMFGIRSELDLLEEYFVTEFAKFLCGQATDFSKLNQSDIQILIYNITRNIDSILMGEISVKTIPIDELVNNSLLDLAINSKSEVINQIPISNLNLANIHRKISNIKSKLLLNGDLTQICE